MIEVKNISKRYGDKQVLSDVSFTAENGIVTGFVGPNGAGKSTTMRMIAALENPDQGETFVDGIHFSTSPNPIYSMGVYLGSDYIPLNLTGKEYLDYICQIGNISKEKIPYLLDSVELTGAENRKISSYSLGMKQRIGLAAAIAGDADTLMLDEPVNGLDPMGVQWLRNLIRSQADSGKAVLLSSHLLAELELIADKIVMLDQGMVVRQGMINNISSAQGKEKHVLVHTSNDQKIAKFLMKKGINVQREHDRLVISGIAPQKLAKFIVNNNLELYLLEEKHLTLEELFLSTASHR